MPIAAPQISKIQLDVAVRHDPAEITARLAKHLFIILFVTVILCFALPGGALWMRRASVLTYALPGVALIAVGVRPDRLTWLLAPALSLAGFLAFVHSCSSGFAVLVMAGSFLGLGSLIAIGVRGLVPSPAPRLFGAFCAAATLLVFAVAVELFLPWTVVLSPKTYDDFLYAFDQSLGLQISFLMGQAFAAWPLLRLTALGAYLLLPTAVASLYAVQLRHPRSGHGKFMAAFVTSAVCGWILYLVYPAAGPIYAFGSAFPANPPVVSSVGLATRAIPEAARNCMPSLHMAWAALIWWNSRGYGRPARIAAAVFGVLTVLATLGLGEHYLVDLVAALPFALAVQAACTTAIPLRHAARWGAVASGALLTALWITALRAGVDWPVAGPWLPWALLLGTVALSVRMEARLAGASSEPA